DGFQSQVAKEYDIGLIIDPLNPDVAAKQLLSALYDTQWLDGVPERSRILAEGRFNRDHLATQLEEILLDVVAKHKLKN
ncbi:MAG: glycosyltransferase, partial [Sphaerospermopsis kisseleviana]